MDEMIEVIKKKVEQVLDSPLTDYRIAKEVGDKSGAGVRKLRDGDSDIDNLTLKKINAYVELHERMDEPLLAQRKYPEWTAEEERFVIEAAKSMSDRQIAEKLGRTPVAVRNRRAKLNNEKI